MPNDITTRGYPLPHPDNVAREDAQRIRDALQAISEDLEGMGISPATETEPGGVRLATAAEATGGTAEDAVPVVKRVKDMITSVTTALHTTIVGEYGAAISTAVTTAINDLKAGVDPAYDTLVEIAAKLTDMTQINAILDSLAKRLRVDTAAQGLDATSKANGRTNLGLGNIATKNAAALADIRSNTGSDPITTDQAWAGAGFIDLGVKAGSVVIDMNAGSRFLVRLGGNVTISVSNPKSGQPLDICCLQDATGGRTVSWSGFLWPNNVVPAVYTAANNWAVMYSGVYNPFTGSMIGGGWKIN